MRTLKPRAVARRRSVAVALLVLSHVLIAAGPAPAGGAAIQISEIRIDQPSTDNDEYFELSGAPNSSLMNLTYLVIGDGTGSSGVVENVTSLSGHMIPADGYFLAAKTEFTLGAKDLTTTLTFENGDNVTHMLVSGFTGSNGQDLDTNDDGTLDTTPWSAILDSVSVIHSFDSGDRWYSASTVGPQQGNVAPYHVIRCGSQWNIGSQDPAGGDDTPGAANSCGDGVAPTSDIAFPQSSAIYSGSTYNAGCADAAPDLCGTAADTGGSGLSKVEVRIQRSSDNYYWNGATWQVEQVWNLATGTATWSYSFDPDSGTYTVSSRATDVANNVSSPTSVTFSVDEASPTASISFPQNGGNYRSATFDAGCADATPDVCGTAADTGGSGLSKVEIRIQRASDGYYWNGTTWQVDEVWNLATGTATWSYAFDPDGGAYTVTAQATDVAGNTGSSSSVIVIDDTAPQTDITSGPSGTVYSTSATFEFSSPDDANATFECSLDGEQFTPCESPLEYTGLSFESHTLEVRAKDQVGNVDPTPASRTWRPSPLKPKNVDLKASRNPVPKGERVVLTATVSPCAGHAGDVVKFQKLLDEWKTIATLETNQLCKAKKRVRMSKKATFRAVSPKQDADHKAGTSEKLTVRIKT